MKLDKIAFARVVAFVSNRGCSMTNDELEQLDNMIDINAPAIGVDPINEMLREIGKGNKIEAIRHYRAMTGESLKYSKDAIEMAMIIPHPEGT